MEFDIRMTKEEKAKAKQDLVNYFNTFANTVDTIAMSIKEAKDWNTLGFIMGTITNKLVDNNLMENRIVFGLLIREFFAAMSKGGSTDADIIAARIIDAYESRVKPLMRETFDSYIKELDNVEEVESTTGTKN